MCFQSVAHGSFTELFSGNFKMAVLTACRKVSVIPDDARAKAMSFKVWIVVRIHLIKILLPVLPGATKKIFFKRGCVNFHYLIMNIFFELKFRNI